MQVREALNAAMEEEMIKDETVYVMGEEVAQYNGAYKVNKFRFWEQTPEKSTFNLTSSGPGGKT